MAAKKRHHSSHRGSSYLREHHEKRGAHGEFESEGHHSSHGRKHHSESAFMREHDIKRGPHGEFERARKSRHHDDPPSHHEMREHERVAHRRHAYEHGHYAGAEPRRRQELEDAGMIHEDHNAIANLPQEVMIKMYPKSDMARMPEELDDTMHGIDHQIDRDYEMAMHDHKKDARY